MCLGREITSCKDLVPPPNETIIVGIDILDVEPGSQTVILQVHSLALQALVVGIKNGKCLGLGAGFLGTGQTR